MKLLLTSSKILPPHVERLQRLLGKEKAEKALVITAAAVPYGLDPKPDWLQSNFEDFPHLMKQYDETSLEQGQLVPDDLSSYDLVYVGGGNVYYLAYALQKTGLDKLIINYINEGGFILEAAQVQLLL